MEKLEDDLETARILTDAHERDLKKIAGDPDRLHKQADKFASAVSSLQQQCAQAPADSSRCIGWNRQSWKSVVHSPTPHLPNFMTPPCS